MVKGWPARPRCATKYQAGRLAGGRVRRHREGGHRENALDIDEPDGGHGCDVDIDARQRLLLALQTAERRYRLLAEHTQSIIYTIDNAGRLTYVSPSWTVLLGHPVEEVIGRDFRPFVHPEDVPLCEDFLARTLRERRVLPPLTYRVLHRDGRVCYHRSMLAPVLDDDGQLQAIVGNAIHQRHPWPCGRRRRAARLRAALPSGAAPE